MIEKKTEYMKKPLDILFIILAIITFTMMIGIPVFMKVNYSNIPWTSWFNIYALILSCCSLAVNIVYLLTIIRKK